MATIGDTLIVRFQDFEDNVEHLAVTITGGDPIGGFWLLAEDGREFLGRGQAISVMYDPR